MLLLLLLHIESDTFRSSQWNAKFIRVYSRMNWLVSSRRLWLWSQPLRHTNRELSKHRMLMRRISLAIIYTCIQQIFVGCFSFSSALAKCRCNARWWATAHTCQTHHKSSFTAIVYSRMHIRFYFYFFLSRMQLVISLLFSRCCLVVVQNDGK